MRSLLHRPDVLLSLCRGAAPAGACILDCARVQSHSYATSSARPDPFLERPAGHGFGFPQRFKDMPNEELKALLSRSKRPAKQTDGPRRMRPLPPAQWTGQHAQQWSKLEARVAAPYRAADINRTDMFAVIEAGSTQFKGVLLLTADQLRQTFTKSASRLWRSTTQRRIRMWT